MRSLGRLRCLVPGLCVEDKEFDAFCVSPREVDGVSSEQFLAGDAELPARLTHVTERDHVERISLTPTADSAGKRDPGSVLAMEHEAGAHAGRSRASQQAARTQENERDTKQPHAPIIGRAHDALNEPLVQLPLVLANEYAAELGQPAGGSSSARMIASRSEIVSARTFVSRSYPFSSFSAVSSKPAPRRSRESARTSASRIGMLARCTRSIVQVFGQASLMISTINGLSPRGSEITRGRPGAPSPSSDSRIAAWSLYLCTRQKDPRARTRDPTWSSPRVVRYSTSPSGNRRIRIGVVGMPAP